MGHDVPPFSGVFCAKLKCQKRKVEILQSDGLKRIITSLPEANRLPSIACEAPSAQAAEDIRHAAIRLGKITLF